MFGSRVWLERVEVDMTESENDNPWPDMYEEGLLYRSGEVPPVEGILDDFFQGVESLIERFAPGVVAVPSPEFVTKLDRFFDDNKEALRRMDDDPDHPCRVMPTRGCPPSYAGVCGPRPCARYESEDETPWTQEVDEPGPSVESFVEFASILRPDRLALWLMAQGAAALCESGSQGLAKLAGRLRTVGG
jgi:hypothetical protein